MKNFIITEDSLSNILTYLISKPYAEVSAIIEYLKSLPEVTNVSYSDTTSPVVPNDTPVETPPVEEVTPTDVQPSEEANDTPVETVV